LLEDDAQSALLRMIDLATVVTPNIRETEVLLGTRIASLADAERAARAFCAKRSSRRTREGRSPH